MRLYNTATRRIEAFHPAGPVAGVYICGITPYDTTHLGHAFTYASADVLIRFLEHQGHAVRYVQNVTDVDDDILRKARESNADWRALGDRWTAHFIADMRALNLRPPDVFPRATDVIPEIVAAVQGLLAAGVAYEAEGSVYFSVSAWPPYGRLSGLPPEARLAVANERGNIPDDPRKRAPEDFVLWQAQAPGEPAWHSPWGAGRPGWHIECSTLIRTYLGETADIHGGGHDLVFPHHESESAQAEALGGALARFWFHTAMVHHAGAKMSKSLGNLVMIADLRREWSEDALRVYLARHHYRQPWAHDPEQLAQAGAAAQTLAEAAVAPSGEGQWLDPAPRAARCLDALADDLNTPAALGLLEALAGDILAAARSGGNVADARETLRRLGGLFGLRLGAKDVEPRVSAGWSQHRRRFAPVAEAGTAGTS